MYAGRVHSAVRNGWRIDEKIPVGCYVDTWMGVRRASNCNRHLNGFRFSVSFF